MTDNKKNSDEDNKKLSADKLQQLQQLIQMKMNGEGSLGPNMAQNSPAKPKFSFRQLPYKILLGMEKSVKFIDQFITFVIQKDTTKVSDVVHAARAPILFGAYIIIIFVVFGLGWAAIAPLDSATVAIGTVISKTNKKEINHQEGGIVEKIYVNVGDKVKAGQKLMEFDATELKSRFQNALNQYRTFLATENRLIAEVNNDDEITFDPFLLNDSDNLEVSKILLTQKNLFQSKKELKNAEKQGINQRTKQQVKQIEGLQARIIFYKKSLEVIRERLDASRKLNKQGFAKKESILDLEAREAESISNIAQSESEIAKSEQEITKLNIDLINQDNKFSTQNLSELREIQSKVAEVRESYFFLSDKLERVIVKSPVDGIVNNINFFTIKSFVPAGQNIFEISPTADTLVIEAKIKPKNIDSITTGLESKIRFSAFKSRTTPLFIGKVVSISPDIIMDQRAMQTDPELGGGYYLARIEIDMENFKEIADPRGLQLQPGMQAEVQIVTGTRTLLRYLLDPLFDAMFRGFKEK